MTQSCQKLKMEPMDKNQENAYQFNDIGLIKIVYKGSKSIFLLE